MFGEHVHRLRVLLWPNLTVLFQKDGNYGDNWNYGQVTLNLATIATVSDITQVVRCLISLLILINK